MQQHKHMMSTALTLTALAGFTATSHAAIVQFEAESGTLGSNFTTAANGDTLDPASGPDLNVAGALGGSVLHASVSFVSGADSVASYSVNFSEAGEYDLYVRLYNAPSGDHDSFFAGTGFGTRDASDFGADAEWHEMNGWGSWNTGGFPGTETVDGLAWNGDLPDMTPVWVNLTANFDENVTTTVPNIGTYTTAGGTETFQIAARESYFLLDAFAFVSTSERDLVAVDGTGNLFIVPEPASVALLGLGGLAMLARRRQA